jgi:hypothetical protein
MAMKRIAAGIRLPATLLSLIVIVSLLMTFTAVPVLAEAAMTLTPSSGPPGTSVTVAGTGFDTSTSVSISFGGVSQTTAVVASGAFSAVITIPVSIYGSHSVTATGSVSTETYTAQFNTEKKVTWNKTSGPPGTSVTLTGAGFGNAESITVSFEGDSVATTSTSSVGAWSKSFVVPSSASGSHSVSITGSKTGTNIIESFTTTPAISLSEKSGAPGATITVTGAGFAEDETGISITFDNNIVTSDITADANGEWSEDFTVPSGASGSHAVGAYGEDTEANDVPTVSFAIGAGIKLNKTTGTPGATITVTGSGFGKTETGICITFDGEVVPSTIQPTNASGGWSGTFTVPAAAAGPHSIGAYGNKSTAENVATITFNITGVITLNKTTGAPGTSITVTGSGFGANETGISITFDGETITSDISANSSGGWSGNFTVPAAAAGSHTIAAHGATSTAVSASLTVAATISLGTATGAPGSTITVTGSGFGADETGISLTLDGKASIVTGITADASGTWTRNMLIPSLAFGSHTISASGSVTQASAANLVSINITASVVLKPTTGNIGSTVIVSGSGFAANSDIRISYDSVEITTLNATTDATGTLSQQITIPSSKAGTHTIAVADSQGNNIKTNFTISDTPPAAPAPTSPTDNKTIGLTGNAKPTFRWSGVTDPNGVTYQLQIDTNPDFAYPVLNKTGIQSNYYALYASEALPRGTYYWRVKAINNASAESSWSAPRTLKSGLLAPWMLALIIVVVVVAIGLGIYYGIIRTQQRKREAITVSEVEMGPGQWQGLELPEESTRERPATRSRLALPEVSRSSKAMATEDQARLKVIVEFAQSIPLAEPDYNVKWLENLVESQTQTQMSVPVYEQLLKGELQIHYEPSWMRHPIYKDLTVVLQKHPILHKLEAFIVDVDGCAAESISLIQQIYRESKADIPQDFLEKGGWGFLTAVYTDAINWYAGKSLNDPTERDYRLETPNGGKEAAQRWLSGEGSTPFAGRLMLAQDEKEALELRAAHLKLRRTWRNSEKARQVSSTITQLQLKRNELLNAFSQFGRMK